MTFKKCLKEYIFFKKGKTILYNRKTLNNFLSRLRYLFGFKLKNPETIQLEVLHSIDSCTVNIYLCIESKADRKFYVYTDNEIPLSKRIVLINYYRNQNKIII